MVNIYSSRDLSKKKMLWHDLLALKETFNDGDWIMGGDFNAVKEIMERKGRSTLVNYNGMDLFAEFIHKSALVDIPRKGKKYSWYSGDGKSTSRIDQFLFSDDVIHRWGIIGQFIGDRDNSDHCPVWLAKYNINWGPKPFKFNNELFSFDSFIPFVEKEWRNLKVEGRGDFILKEKLRLLKEKLRWWNKEVFGKVDLEVEEGVRDLNAADYSLERDRDISCDAIVAKRKEASNRFWRNLRIKENMLVQKSRVRWMKEGDSNSKFFHCVMKERIRVNHLGPIVAERVSYPKICLSCFTIV